MDEVYRCSWVKTDIDQIYHDTEWGIPSHDDYYLFEMLILEGFQAGLSWTTILKKRENFRKAFDYFDYEKIAKYSDKDLYKLLEHEGIIRNKLKIFSTRTNAQQFLKVQAEFGSFDTYIWSFTKNKQIINYPTSSEEVGVTSVLSDTVSKDMKKRGFKFIGSTIIQSYLQAIGVIDDHLISCKFKIKDTL